MSSNVKFYKSTMFWISALTVVFATAVNLFNSELIQLYFPERQTIIDTLFLLTPQIMWTQYLTDIAVLVAPIILLFFIVKRDYKYLPYYLMVFALAYLFRGLLILLNPIGGYFGNTNTYGLTSIMQHGMFPSGHTILVFVAYYLSKEIVPRSARKLLLAFCYIEVIALILSRGHYGIDIVGGILVSYFVYNELTKHKERFDL